MYKQRRGIAVSKTVAVVITNVAEDRRACIIHEQIKTKATNVRK